MWKALLCVFCLTQIFNAVLSEQGSCPPAMSADKCQAGCGPTRPCTEPQLCCPTSCGGSMCVDPVTRHRFVNLVKSGKCPERPRGAWVCTDMCTIDSDCRKALKCCPNRCGALTCQLPQLD